jgi:DNA-binding transcriptional LysR family regulator
MNLLRDTSWDALLAFAEFADERNFTRAAARLHLSQPALHTKIANLGVALGTTLYVRRGRQIEITDAGRKVQRFARELADSAAAFQAEFTGSTAQAPVVLAAGEGAFLYLLGAGIRAFRADRTHLLRLETARADLAVDAVSSGRAHLGVAALAHSPKNLAVTPLTLVGQVLAMPSRHRLASSRPARLTDLRDANLILAPEGRPHRALVSQALQSANVDWRLAVEATGWELMLHFVRLGLGLAIVNACCKIPAGVVVRPLPELPPVQYHVFHARRPLSKSTDELKQALLREADSWKSGGI